ncbi:MAG: hypothetical protein J1F40_03815 [Prevotellaceae bacterium]|nr:hypothetical protein [Prevotellaceae bacterium]
MKRFSLILFAISIAIIGKAQILVISDTDKSQDFEVPSTDKTPGGWNFNILSTNLLQNNNNCDNKWTPSLTSFYFGFIGGANQADDVSINMGQSYELGIDNILSAESHLSKGVMLSIGLGMGWRNHRMTNQKMFAKHDDGSITIEPYPAGANPKFSRIHTWGFVVPIKFSFRLGKLTNKRAGSHRFSIGPELYYTPHASLKTRYILDRKQKLKDNNLHFNKVTVGLQAECLINGDIGVYCKYNPFPVLDTDYAPKFSSITVGLTVSP